MGKLSQLGAYVNKIENDEKLLYAKRDLPVKRIGNCFGFCFCRSLSL